MGKNKNKKIHKQSQSSAVRKIIKGKGQRKQKQQQSQQMLNEHQQGLFKSIQQGEDEEQGLGHEFQFQEYSQREQQVEGQDLKQNGDGFCLVQKQAFQGGFLYSLEFNQTYKISNQGDKPRCLWLLEGQLDYNKRIIGDSLNIADSNSIYVYAIQHKNKQKSEKSKKIEELQIKVSQKSAYKNKVLIYTESEKVDMFLVTNKQKPWTGLQHNKLLYNNPRTLVIGPKNSGKSTFCQAMLNLVSQNKIGVVVIDVDIGRNMVYPGTVSITVCTSVGVYEQIALWVGQFTPLNCINLYIQAVKRLVQYAQEKYFTCSIFVNTMGYLTGIGELMIYQVFNIVKPHHVLAISSEAGHWATNPIIKNISNGTYLQRLHLSQNSNQTPIRCTTETHWYVNKYSEQKRVVGGQHFQKFLSTDKIKNIQQLISKIVSNKLRKLQKNIQLYRKKDSNITQLQFYTRNDTQMRLIVLGQFWNGFIRVIGFAYGWQQHIYCDHRLLKHQVTVGVITDGVDMERGFYLISQSKLIQIEDMIGHRIPYLQPCWKVLGSKGMRNNPGKKAPPN